MKLKLNDFGTGWISIELGVKTKEIDILIGRLLELKSSACDHFVIANSSSDQSAGVENVEIYLDDSNEKGNMQILSGNINPDS